MATLSAVSDGPFASLYEKATKVVYTAVSGKVETVCVHHLIPGGHEVM